MNMDTSFRRNTSNSEKEEEEKEEGSNMTIENLSSRATMRESLIMNWMIMNGSEEKFRAFTDEDFNKNNSTSVIVILGILMTLMKKTLMSPVVMMMMI